ncbi:MAG: acyl-ACP--UDP-N-acetylglucosamine O-acyltransferase [Candidatus Hydrogenedentes bacterium]|nr:acyl-ACP--UDP-N-acetylglucosamine O-acyltransferase [Candidatus Hydrogenedentota bacterium]
MPIHPTAIIHPSAELAANVDVQAFSIIEAHVHIGSNSVIGPHNVIGAGTVMGENNRTYSGAQVGVTPQDLKHKLGKAGRTVLGDSNIIREFVTVSSSTVYDGEPEETQKETRIGSHCLLMSTCHVGHDSTLGDHVIIANGVPLAGHVTIHDRAFIGGLTGIHQFCVIGTMAFIGGMARINKDVPPYMLCEGHPARCFGPNTIGLERNGLSPEQIKTIRNIYKILYRSKLNISQAVSRIESEIDDCNEKKTLLDFIANSQRGLTK